MRYPNDYKGAGEASPLARPCQPAALPQAESAAPGALAQRCLPSFAEWRMLLILFALLCSEKEQDFRDHAGLLHQWMGHIFEPHLCPSVAFMRRDSFYQHTCN